MSRPINIQETLTFIPNELVSAHSSYSSISGSYPITNAYTNSSSTTYAYITCNTGSRATTYVSLKFPISGIPSNATIDSVVCKVKARVSSTSYLSTAVVQLYNGNTAMGSSVSAFTTTATVYTISNPGNWTASTLNNIEIRYTGTRGTSNTSRAAYLYFYGADLTITYSVSGTEYEITSTLATDEIDNIVPSGLTTVFEGNNYELVINGANIDNIMVEDNGVNVTSALVQHASSSGSFTFTGIPVSFDSTNSRYDTTGGDNGNGIYSTNYIENGLTDHTSTTRAALYSVQGSGASSYMYYNFDCSSIPYNAVITSVTCQFNGGTQGSTYYSSYTAQLTTGTTLKGSSASVTGTNTSPTTVTINGGLSWTREELDNIKIKFQVTRGSSSTTTASTWSFYGATLTVNYTVEAVNPYYWTYSLSNIRADHTIIIKDEIIEIPDEDPSYDYYSVTISSINAITTPGRGTIRLVEGSNQTIEIYPQDPSITLITDNGVDVTNMLVAHSAGSPTYTVNTASGASYGFNPSTNGYYISNNKGVNTSAAVSVINFDLPVRCLVTIQFINYAEEQYDFGVFGNIDVPLSNDYYAASSGGATITDTNYKLACNTSSYNTSNVQTLTYEISAGNHSIYVKYSKDDATADNNDTLQFKVSSIQELEPNNYYTYTLNNIQSDHSLIFIFGDVVYYFINSSGTNARLFPAGSMVYLPGDNYLLTIVPNDYSYTVSVTDNNADVTSSVERVEKEVTKDGSTYTVVNYEYRINNVNAAHNIVATCSGSSLPLYIKLNGAYVQVQHIFRKTNNTWANVELSSLTDPCIYVYKESY